jgi:hypothetical protein
MLRGSSCQSGGNREGGNSSLIQVARNGQRAYSEWPTVFEREDGIGGIKLQQVRLLRDEIIDLSKPVLMVTTSCLVGF